MRYLPLAAALVLSACGDKDTDTEVGEDHALCGEVVLEDAYCSAPDAVDVMTLLPDATPCDDDALFYDTGGGTEWEPWYDETVAQPEVDAEDLSFSVEELEAGDYAVRHLDVCYGCESVTVVEGSCAEVTLALTEIISVDAPNIYLYPEVPTGVRVRLPAPDRLVASAPTYPDGGWWVVAEPDGLLHTEAGLRDYLFYEMVMDVDLLEVDAGWCVDGALAQASIEHAMAAYGFLEPEIDDFAEFWDPVFPGGPAFTVRPASRALPTLGISPRPDHLLRTWFVVEPGCAPDLREPWVEPVPRTGYHAAEWGVILVDAEVDRAWAVVSGLP